MDKPLRRIIAFPMLAGLLIFSNQALLSQQELNGIQTTVPFLTLIPDARSGGLGNTGVANSPDIYSQNWNLAKYAFMEGNWGAGFSYYSHLRSLIQGINHFYLSGFYRLNEKNVFSSSVRYFSLGQILQTVGGTYTPREFAFDLGYSRVLSENFSGGILLRYIQSDLTSGVLDGGQSGRALAGDIGFFYWNEDVSLTGPGSKMGLGMSISNIGNKISYTENGDAGFLPGNLRLGASYTLRINEDQDISFMADLNKLLVPTPPVYAVDSMGRPLRDPYNNPVIAYGMDPNVSVPGGMMQSFYDAPGFLQEDGSRSVFREEMAEIMIGLGIEYKYRDMIALRGGYIHEHEAKGNRQFFTLGIGLQYWRMGLDFSYLIPADDNNSMKNSFWISFTFEA